MFQSIVVAVDGSDPSMRAVDAACALARAFGSEVHLVHASDRSLVARAAATKSPAPADVLASAKDRAAASGVAAASAIGVEGDPFEEIMTIIGLYGADLIVTGRRGLGNIGGLIAGSISQRIAKEAGCAHLSVK